MENGELNAAEVPFDDAFTLTCDPGYKASRETANCVADTGDAESTVNAGEPLQCDVQRCDGKPQVTDAEAVECDSDPKYKSECTVRCKEGFRYGATGAQSQTGVVTCEAVEGSPSEVQWGAALECVPVTCAVPEAGDFTQASTAAQEPVLYGKELPLTCDQGYGTNAADVESASYTALCTVDADYNSKYDDSGEECVELDCQPLSTIANGFTLGLSEGISSSEPFKAGSKSEFKCSTGKRVSDDYQYVTCIAGTITMCNTQDCTETTTALSDTDTACMDKAASTVTENRVNSEMTMVMSVGGRRLSAAALEDKKEALELAFRNGMAEELGLPVANVQVTGTSFKSIDATSVEVVISFYVLVPSDQEVTALESKVTSMSEDPNYDFDEFKKGFAAEMAEAGVTLSVEDIAVAEPVVTAVQVAKPPPKEDDDAEEGGGGPVIIIVVVLLVLAVIGVVVWKFVLKK